MSPTLTSPQQQTTVTSSEQPPTSTQPRPARSKNGCNACRRRKVRCNEQRPRCSHCDRLNLECTWTRLPAGRSNSTCQQSLVTSSPQQHHPFASGVFPLDGYGFGFDMSGPLGVGAWDEAMLLSPNSFPADSLAAAQSLYQLPDPHQSSGPVVSAAAAPVTGNQEHVPDHRNYRPDPNSTSPLSTEGVPNGHVNEEFLLSSFLQMLMPPILTPVEVGPKWASTRAFFAAMAAESPVVKSAIMAFAAMQMQRNGLDRDGAKLDWRTLYDNAARQLPNRSAKAQAAEKTDAVSRTCLKHILAALFLLTYTDLLTETLPRAHANLREAYMLIQNAKKVAFSTPERRLVSWLRLLDARAVSTAGGEGLFLADTDETIFNASPAADAGSESENLDVEIEEVLFDVLYQPGILFFQQVQTFSGRITRIDPWRRSRGTVEDETEVMALAAQISKDLHALYDQRPVLMDHAVAGNLTEKHLAKNLAGPLTRSFRSYLANYYAAMIHLHRVAYVQYPKTKDVINAIANIKRLCHVMAESDESLPVNVLWPLLMWGCEEDDVEERRWILEAMRNLSTEATNAKATADLLEAVQKRQDEGGRRVDCRLVSSELFASSNHFAIV